MSGFDNGLSKAQQERLELLAEECAEVIQIVMKILRHGLESYHPDDDPNAVVTNRRLLEKELGHERAAVELLLHEGDIVYKSVVASMHQKLKNVQPYLHHQPYEMFRGI